MWQSPSQKTVVGLQNIVFRSQKITPINKGQSQSTATDTIQYSNTFVFVCPSTSALVRNYPVSASLYHSFFASFSFQALTGLSSGTKSCLTNLTTPKIKGERSGGVLQRVTGAKESAELWFRIFYNSNSQWLQS
jgi:hypothetical protein